MTDKYCVTIQGVPNPRRHHHTHEYDTRVALLEVDQTLSPIRVFESIDEAIGVARLDKIDHPDWVYEIRRYLGTNTDMNVIEKYGRWKLSAEILHLL